MDVECIVPIRYCFTKDHSDEFREIYWDRSYDEEFLSLEISSVDLYEQESSDELI